MSLLNVENLNVTLQDGANRLEPVQAVSFALEEGEALGIVGESGCGKTLLALSLLNLLPPSASRSGGGLTWIGRDFASATEADWRGLRGKEAAIVFQEPSSALNPVMTVGDQVKEAILIHSSESDADRRVLDLLRQVKIANPEKRVNQYPHELSGGMKQRVMIAMALSCDPKVLILDEPTTSLDVTIQAQVMELLQELRKERRLSMILISHDLSLVRFAVDRIAVMYAGSFVEMGSAEQVLQTPRHPYTKGLLGSLLKPGQPIQGIPGSVPQLHELPPFCRFAPRCDRFQDQCNVKVDLASLGPGHEVRCVRSKDE